MFYRDLGFPEIQKTLTVKGRQEVEQGKKQQKHKNNDKKLALSKANLAAFVVSDDD